jgi:hypothetical protein
MDKPVFSVKYKLQFNALISSHQSIKQILCHVLIGFAYMDIKQHLVSIYF